MTFRFKPLLAAIAFACSCAPALAQPEPQSPPPQLPPTQVPPKPAAQDGFLPIDQLAPKEELPATPLVISAYAVAWLIVFGYVVSLWRRMQKVETEIADVSRRLASGARK
jgi:CcmD family protein